MGLPVDYLDFCYVYFYCWPFQRLWKYISSFWSWVNYSYI